MSYGTPCVATDTCGIPEDITGDVNGLLVRRNPISEIPERLAEAIEKLLDDTNLARRIGQSGMMSYFRQHDETDVIASLRALHQRFGC
jgi:glycosyltransferase involved in cell wall biosynthesis